MPSWTTHHPGVLPGPLRLDKLARALKGVIDEERFTALTGRVFLPFPAGEHARVAVKVLDPRGNEVMRVHRLPPVGTRITYA